MKNRHKKSILLVEDEVITAMLEVEQLKDRGYNVTHVIDGEEAIKFITDKKNKIDLILMDIDLGDGIDGTETAKIILTEKDIPILFLSSHIEPEIVEKTEKISSYGYVIKNSEIAVLDASIKMAFKLYDSKIKEKINEEALSESDDNLKAIFNTSPDIMLLLDTDGIIIYTNEILPKRFNLEINQVIGNSIYDYTTKESLNGRKLAIEKVIETKESFLLIDKGRNGIFESYFQPIINSFGEVQSIAIYARDIKKRKLAEEKLKKSEKKYRDLFEKSKDAILIIENGKFIDCNKSTIDLLHYNNKEDFLNVHPSKLSPENQPDGKNSFIQANEMINIALKNGSHRFEWNHKKFNGEIFPVEVLLTTISNDEYKKILHTVWRDITERKQAERALVESEERHKFLSENMADIVWIVDKDFKTTYVSPSIKKILGFTPEERKKQSLVEMITPESLKSSMTKYTEEIQRDNDSKVDSNRNTYTEVEYYHADGHTIWMGNYTKAVRDHTGAVIGLYGTSRDISENKQSEKALKRAAKENRVLLKELQHRAKNSFSMITSLIELTADAASSNIEKSSLTDIGSRIRAVSEMYDLLYTTDSVSEIRLDEYFFRITSSLPGIPSNITINCNYEAITISVKTAIPLGMIITELLTNSIKYAFPNSRKGIINISLFKKGSVAVIDNNDNGIGIPKDIDISTIDSMGLKLVQTFTAQINGNFKIENKNGTQCIIEFPLEKE